MLSRKKILFRGGAAALLSAVIILSGVIYHKTFYYTGDAAETFPALNRNASTFPKIADGIWLHRVNSIERLNYFLNDFSGFEMDLYYNDKLDNFNVDHNNKDYHTTLDAMLAAAEQKPGVYLWLDVKNLSIKNAEAVFSRLGFLFQKHNVAKDHVIIESPVIEALNGYAAAGYLTSYYFAAPDGPPDRERLDKLRARFYNSDVRAVSSDLVYYDLIGAAFPGIPHLFWDLKSYSRKPLTRIAALIRMRAIFNDPDVKVLLVGDFRLRR